ncbi:MAG: hypothetical protein KBD50_00595 [Candidatus Pacebacteria bacterium]|nr:hypothetical protein [Candidatus Paceibacterota bacterium]
MVEQQDSFWKLFFTATAGVLAIAAFVITILLLKPSDELPTLPHENATEPYAYVGGPELTATSTYFYRESIPLGFSNTSWSANANWRSKQKHFEGTYSARAEFTGEWGGLSLAGRGLPSASYAGISLALFAEPGLQDLYLELYNAAGATVGRQSIGWYFPSGKLEPGAWQMIAIPLRNFGVVPATIGGFAIISPQKGVVYVDDVHLAKNAPAHAAWAPAPEVAGASIASLTELFARTKQTVLPYWLPHDPQQMLEWHAPTGQFSISEKGITAGPPAKGGGMHAAYLGGQIWTDYRVNAVTNWGSAASISLVARIRDENSQVSCSFSQYGGVIQIYAMKDGISELIKESAYVEALPPQIHPWTDIPLGIEVKGDRVNCYAYGRLSLTATPKNMPAAGSVGIEVWDEQPNKEPHIIKTLGVEPR